MRIGNYRSQFKEAIHWYWHKNETPKRHWWQRINYPEGYWTPVGDPRAREALMLDDELGLAPRDNTIDQARQAITKLKEEK